jgi:hypothetical protein
MKLQTSKVPNQPPIQVTSPPSYYLFSCRDIQEALWVMNTNKTTDEEGFQAELFKHGLHTLDNYLVDMFNHVARIGFLQSWSHHIIQIIHKSSAISNPNNYRTIMVGHTFSKLFAIVLHMQLSRQIDRRHLQAKGWVGFHPAHQTIDHILTLQPIIEEACHCFSTVYCYFVDFRKAFGSIPQEGHYFRDFGTLAFQRPY